MAIARKLPNSIVRAQTMHFGGTDVSFSLEKAKREHEKYISELRSVLPVYEISALEEFPDSVFVEDTAVAFGRRAVLCHPGHPTRVGEVESIKEVLISFGVDIVADMRGFDNAHCDGGDVLVFGETMLVGLSNRTNAKGAGILRDTFGENCHILPPTMQGSSVLHLKSAVTAMNHDTIVVPEGAAGDSLIASIEKAQIDQELSIVRVPDVFACNMVACNNHVFFQDVSCVETRSVLEDAAQDRSLESHWVDTSELAKKDAALTCCSILLDI